MYFKSTILLRYMMLEYYRRQCSVERTIPGLCHVYVRELQMLAVHVCIQLILLEVLQLIARHGQGILSEQAVELVGGFYLQYLSGLVEEHRTPTRTLVMTSDDGKN